MKEFKIGFIGAGNIASAIFNGITSSGYIKPEKITVFDTQQEKVEGFVKVGAVASSSAELLVDSSDYVFLTVKPQVYPDLLNRIRLCSKETCFVDVAAGITIEYVKSALGYNAAVIRVMPNTPLMCGLGASALVKADPVTDNQFEFICGCFDACGVTCVVDEKHINTVTAISGSAPAYIMRFAKDIIDFAVKQGMSFEDAETLVLQTFSGSAEMIKKSDQDITELIRMVTSPKGTTEAGLHSLDSDGFDDIVDRSLVSTVKRAEELSK